MKTKPIKEELYRWNFREGRDLGFGFSPRQEVRFVAGCFRIRVVSEVDGSQPDAEIRNWLFPGACLPVRSPEGLRLDLGRWLYAKLTLLNLSPETDGAFVLHCGSGEDRCAGFAMKPYHNRFQEIVCPLNRTLAADAVGSFDLFLSKLGQAGDIFVREIKVFAGGPPAPFPQVEYRRNLPMLNLPDVTQQEWAGTFDVLEVCTVTEVPSCGFVHGPYTGPGGGYGACWWQTDTSYMIGCMLFANPAVARSIVENFMTVIDNSPDGHIDLFGMGAYRGLPAPNSSLPRSITEFCNYIRCTDDFAFNERVFENVKRYLDWFFLPHKFDERTGLVCGIFEETNLGDNMFPLTKAQVDLNVEVAVGCRCVADTARLLGHAADAARYQRRFDKLRASINRGLWDEERGAFFGRYVKEERLEDRLVCSTFDTLRFGIADGTKRRRMLRLLDEAHFNWDSLPLTSVAKTDPSFCIARGTYDGESWKGDVWTARNFPVIKGLHECGLYDLERHLIHRTLRVFRGQYCEYVTPDDRSPEGVRKYAWTASHYIQIVVCYLFGIELNAYERTVTVFPRVPKEYEGLPIALEGLKLPGGGTLSVSLETDGRNMRAEITAKGVRSFSQLVLLAFGKSREAALSGRHVLTIESD